MARCSLSDLHDLAVAVLTASKTSPDNAAAVARALVKADADGIPSHGVSRLPAYADQAKAGKVDGFAAPDVTMPKSASVRVDAKSGFAYPAIEAGISAALASIKETGIVGLAIGNSHHAGVAGHHVEPFAEAGYLALGFTNSPAGIAPWGGSRAIFGTNPIAFGCPLKGKPPIIADLSTSKVARGKIKLAADKGEGIPEGWAVDADGNPTTDAKAAMGGSLLPMGDAKGAALVMMVEILAATLTGSNHGFEASSFFDDKGPPPHIGQFFIVIDPAGFSGGAFDARMEVLADAILSQEGTRMPGARRFGIRETSARDGVDIPDSLIEDLKTRAG
ncbi:MAG: Ldh family oxidoreductase [Rhodospirillales bacterium]|nr:Ldh family oxidoreductase [Rhodospirillales bacterium]MBO6788801.1 Ldh family oxidoreductase [Rhodospirillales bacterium]